MKTFYVEVYFRKDIKVKGFDNTPMLDDYKQVTKQLKILAISKEDMISKVLKVDKDVAYIHIIEVQQEQIQ